MNRNIRLKVLEKKMNPPAKTIQAFLPDWLQDADYVEPEPTGKVIKPMGYLALQPDGTVKYKD